MKQNKKVAVALAVAGALSIAGGAFAAGAWFTKGNYNNTISTGEAIVMTLAGSATNNQGLYPGDTATIALTANNDGYKSNLKVALDVSGADFSQYFTITYKIGNAEQATPYDAATGIVIEAAEEDQTITFAFKLGAEDEAQAVAEKTITVAFTLDPVHS